MKNWYSNMKSYIKNNKIKSGFIMFLGITIALFLIYVSKLTGYSTSILRNNLEALYFVTNSFLLLVAIVGLRQLSIAKETSKMNAKRESFHLAAEQCTHFLNYIIPLSHEAHNSFESKSIGTFGEVKFNVQDKKISFDIKLNKKNFLLGTDKKNIEEMTKMITLLNAIEAYSVFFTHRVADEKVAFSTIGSTYCKLVKDYFPFVLIYSNYGEKGYSNIIKLYIAWSQKLEKQKVLKNKLEAEEKAKGIVTIDFKSLGT